MNRRSPLGRAIRREVAVATPLAAIAFSGCGGSSSSSSTATTASTQPSTGTRSAAVALPPGTPVALRGRQGGVLLGGDFPGFVPSGYGAPSTSVQSWVAEYPPELRASEAASLKALGFVAGSTEHLMPPAQDAIAGREALSVVQQFRSSHGASGNVAVQLKRALASGQRAFVVPGIPGAKGFGSTASTTDANVAFAVGPYYYLVGFSSPSAGAPTQAQLITAAQRLYGRVRG
ncbi:MAG TPA: hypothetical protein VHY83_06580 [Solirubrobacteraceae bacterium]|jgi:hypothetical protein|nr:hypothetical protein [Solirubrobacteraceae bacterium]